MYVCTQRPRKNMLVSASLKYAIVILPLVLHGKWLRTLVKRRGSSTGMVVLPTRLISLPSTHHTT